MFWSKKEYKGLPELPPLKPVFRKPAPQEEPMPEPPQEEIIESNLPEFPEEKEELPEIPESRTPRMQTPMIREFDETRSMGRMTAEMSPSKKTEDVYVKIDRFHSARKSLAAAKAKLHEIEQLLGKIRETRLREEQELASWEKEIDLVKAKVEDVTKNIFEKVE